MDSIGLLVIGFVLAAAVSAWAQFTRRVFRERVTTRAARPSRKRNVRWKILSTHVWLRPRQTPREATAF